MAASFGEHLIQIGVTYDCNSTAANLSFPCNHSIFLNWSSVSFILYPKYSDRYRYILNILFITEVLHAVISILGVIGNALVFYVIGYRKMKRNSEDIYVLSLAFADIITSLIVVFQAVVLLMGEKCNWNCKRTSLIVPGGICTVTTCASAWILVCISLNRYR